jgi:MFS family permease
MLTTNPATAPSTAVASSAWRIRAYQIAWVLALCFYFLEYAARAAPAVMIQPLELAFGINAVGVSTIIGSYYYTYSITALVAGAALDRTGARKAVPVGVFILTAGCLLFSVQMISAAYAGRLLQGAGSAFAFVGAAYLATHGFSARWLATAIGATQCLGMLGGYAGQFVVGPWLEHGLGWQTVWHWLAISSFAVGVLLLLVTPSMARSSTAPSGWGTLVRPYSIVFRNPQSYLCGIVMGLLFAPTTIGDMIWGVAFFQSDRMFSYHDAVVIGSLIPFGWVVGCPVLGWLTDFFGRRKPVLIGGAIGMFLALAFIAFSTGRSSAELGCFLFGVASGVAMIPHTITKEVNPDEAKASAIACNNFLAFAVTALLGPIFAALFGRNFATTPNHLEHFRDGALFWMGAVVLAIILSLFLRETGHGRKSHASAAPE